jgi:hypothetical protein
VVGGRLSRAMEACLRAVAGQCAVEPHKAMWLRWCATPAGVPATPYGHDGPTWDQYPPVDKHGGAQFTLNASMMILRYPYALGGPAPSFNPTAHHGHRNLLLEAFR